MTCYELSFFLKFVKNICTTWLTLKFIEENIFTLGSGRKDFGLGGADATQCDCFLTLIDELHARKWISGNMYIRRKVENIFSV